MKTTGKDCRAPGGLAYGAGGPDDLDIAILAELAEDSDICAKKLAGMLGVHSNTLLHRMRRLRQNGSIVKSVAIIDYAGLGYTTEVLVFINVRVDSGWEEQLRPLAQLPCISFFMFVTGAYDAVALIRLRNEKDLPAIIREIQRNSVVVKTVTHIVLEHWKKPHDFNPFRAWQRAGAQAVPGRTP
jgi:DNA-binding Lrp family transcriptional regulator